MDCINGGYYRKSLQKERLSLKHHGVHLDEIA